MLRVDRPDLKSDARHAVDQRGALVLAERGAAGVAHGQEALGTVASHAGQDDADGARRGDARHRLKQHIDRGPVARHQRALVEAAIETAAAARQFQVVSSGRNIDMSPLDRLILLRFMHPHTALRIEPAGKGSGEAFRHVLGDQHGRHVLRQQHEHRL